MLGALALMLSALGLSGCGKAGADQSVSQDVSAASSVEVTPAKLMSIRDMISMPGSFVAAQGASANLTAPTTGRISKVLVTEGQKVVKGQLLATLDTGVQVAQAQSANAAAQAASAEARQAQIRAMATRQSQDAALLSAKAALKAAEAQSAADITTAEINLTSAQADNAKIQAGARPQELAQAHEAVLAALAAEVKSQKDLARVEELSKVGYASHQQLDDAKAAEQSAKANYNSAVAQESLVKAGARSVDRAAAEAKVVGAQKELAATKQMARERILQAQAVLSQAEAGELTVKQEATAAAAAQSFLKQKQAEAGAAIAAADLNQIRAPFSGVIVRRMLNSGDLADPSTTVLQLVSSSKTDFVGTLTASQAREVKAGMKAVVSPDGGTASDGQVLSISTADPMTGVCRIRIACSADAVVGATGNAKVILKVDSGVVAVPNSCIIQRDGKYIVFADASNVAKQIVVDLGPVDGEYTEIKGGVQAGELMIELGQFELDDGTKIKVISSGSDGSLSANTQAGAN